MPLPTAAIMRKLETGSSNLCDRTRQSFPILSKLFARDIVPFGEFYGPLLTVLSANSDA